MRRCRGRHGNKGKGRSDLELIWDFDGTLFDTYPLMARSLQEALREEGREAPLEEIRAQMEVTLGHALEYYQAGEATVRRYRELLYVQGAKGAQPFAGVPQILARICREGGHNHLCTHRGTSALMYLDAWKLSRYFTVLVTDQNGFSRKPAPDGVNYILSQMRLPARQFVMIGDRELDVEAGHRAGIRACRFIGSGRRDVETSAEYAVENFEDFFDVVKEE